MAARPLQAHLNGAKLDIEQAGDFGERHLFVRRENQNDALRFRKLSDGARDSIAHLRLKCFVLRTGLRRGWRRTCFFTAALQRLLPGSAEEVCSQRAALRIIRRACLQENEKANLDDIFGVRHRTSQPKGKSIDGEVMSIE